MLCQQYSYGAQLRHRIADFKSKYKSNILSRNLTTFYINKMASNTTDYKESILKMASSAISASKTGWSRARQVHKQLCFIVIIL